MFASTRLIRVVLFLLAMLACLAVNAQKSGANYWGDADGNGIIEIPDLIALNAVVGDPAGDDSLLFQGHPRSRQRQDLDGNGIIEVPDLIILNSWVAGDFSNRPGNPDRLFTEGAAFSVAPGESVTLRAYALSPVAAGGALRTGFGVVFLIDPSSTCASAELLGYDVAGGATFNAWRTPAAYHYTLAPGAPDNSRASVKFRAAGCVLGQTVRVRVYIPSDLESGAFPGRFPQNLEAGIITISILPSGCRQVMSLSISPSSPVVEQGATILFKAVCTLGDASTVDCTSSYCGAGTAWTGSGHLTQLVPSNLVRAQTGFGSGTVTAVLDLGFAPPVSDSEPVTVTDLTAPDTGISSAPPALSASAGASFSFTCSEASCSFECMLDDQPWSGCSSPAAYAALPNGTHTFLVRAKDLAGNIDPTPSSFSWTIDTAAPETKISFFPANPNKQSSATFAFSCSESPCSFECKLDGSTWSTCASPKTYSPLAKAQHTFQVRASDAAGNTDPTPATHTWTITNTLPAVEYGKAPATGNLRVLVLLVNFADTAPTFRASDFQQLLFANAPGSMRDYFQQASYGQLSMTGDVFGWISVSGTHDYYGNSRAGKGATFYPRNLFAMAEEAIDQAYAMGVDFSNYDGNGDSWVDALIIVHQGQGGERSGSMNDIRTTIVPLTSGGPLPRFYNGVKVEYFETVPELAGPGQQMEIGLIAHEFAPFLGMKDDYALFSSTQFGVGNFDLLSYGCWGGDDQTPTQPIYPSPFQKGLAGWLNPLVVNADTILVIPPAETNAYAAKLLFGSDDREYFLVTNQQPIGYDQKIPASGTLVWHVDEKAYLGNAWSATRDGHCTVSSPYFHPMIALEQADGLYELENGLNPGNMGDSFPVGAGFSTLTSPDSYSFRCFPSGVELSVLDSSAAGSRVQARFRRFQTNSSVPQFWLKDYYFEPVAGRSDSDSYPEANEEMRLRARVMNTGVLAQGVSVQAGSTSPYVSVISPNASYPDLLTGDSALNVANIRLRFLPTGCDEAQAVLKLQFSANSGAYSFSRDLRITIGHPALLLVDDDGGERTEDLFTDAFKNGNMFEYSFDTWETAKLGAPTLQHMQNHRAVVWITGPEQTPLNSQELKSIQQYLDSGGVLVLSSAYLLLNPGNAVQTFARNYLGLLDWQDNYFAIQNITGLSLNPVSDGLDLSLLLQSNYIPIFPRNVGLLPGAGALPIFKNNLNIPVMVQHYSAATGAGVIYSSFGIEHLSRNVLYLDSAPVSGLLRRMINAARYQPGQPVVLAAQPWSIQAGTSGVTMTLNGVDLRPDTVFSFPEQGVQIVSQVFNPADRTVRLKVDVQSNAAPGWRKISAQNPGVPAAVYDRYLRLWQ
jgi:M6 family metalloprotease-like protein